ncbi:hypothetical protein PC128_g15897 [Phytophthora cactorum]|nr:hypothetical protein PC128_g15897 [Phytophthora cactorum]
MQFFATPKDSLVAAALEASMRSVRLCNDNANAFSLEEHQRWCAERVKERVVLKSPTKRASVDASAISSGFTWCCMHATSGS